MFIDAEHALDSAYARAIGVDMTNLYLAQPDNGEQGVYVPPSKVPLSGTAKQRGARYVCTSKHFHLAFFWAWARGTLTFTPYIAQPDNGQQGI